MADSEKKSGKKGGKGKLLGGVGALAVVGVVLYVFVLGGGGGEEAAAETTTTVAVEGAVIEAGELTVNLADPGETRYARVGLAVVLAFGADSGVVGERIALLQDAALSELNGFTSDELLAPTGADELRGALTDRALEIWPDGEVLRVVLTELIVQ